MSIDLNGFRKALKAIADDAERLNAKAGWLANSPPYEDGTSVAYVAAIQEYGAPEVGILARPFIGPTIKENKAKWKKRLAKGLKNAISKGGDAGQTFEAVALEMAGDMKAMIAQGSFAPLSPVTLMIRKIKQENKGDASWRMSKRQVAVAAARVAMGESGSANTTPLNDTGLMMASIVGFAQVKGA
jgi:hypothetical protein